MSERITIDIGDDHYPTIVLHQNGEHYVTLMFCAGMLTGKQYPHQMLIYTDQDHNPDHIVSLPIWTDTKGKSQNFKESK